jgi:pilus assembly protein TadC
METIILSLVFLLVFGLTFGGYLVLSRRRRRAAARLEEGPGEEPAPDLVLGELTPVLAAQLPVTEEDRTDLQRELRTAGYYRPTALVEYAAVRAVLIVMPVLAAGVLALVTDSFRQAVWVWVGGVVAALLGFSLPRLYLHFRSRARLYEIERALPTALDMLTLCLSAGLNMLTSLERVVRELYCAYPVLAAELDIVRRQTELRTLEFALDQFADRVGLPQVRNLAVILSQSESLGTDTVSTLREYADSMRISLRQRADEVANKAAFKLLFPAYLLALGAGILLISPAILEFSSFARHNLIGNALRQSREDLGELRNLPPSVPQNPPEPAP